MAGHPVPSGIYDDYGNQWYDDGTPAGFWADGNGLVVNRNDGSPTGQYATSMPYYEAGPGGTTPPASHVSVSVNTPIQSQQGRYTTQVDSDGSVTGEAGAVYQIDNYDGSINVIHHPTKTVNPRDKNNDGLDDTTGFAVGVYKDQSSPSGYYYPEADGTVVPVLPNGAPYHGSDMTPNKAATLHYFSSGGVEYAYDPATGESKAIGGRPTASSSSGGGTVRVGSGSSGGSGSSSASAAAQISAAASQANAALSAQIERERMKQAADQFAQTFGLDQQKVQQAAQQFDYQKTKDAIDQATQRGKITAAFVANPNDLIARGYWLHSGLEPTGTPVNIFTGQASGGPTTQGALNDVQSMQAAGGMASSAPPPPAATTPPPPGYAKGTRGYTTAPVFKTGEKGTEMIQNPSGAPIRVLNHQQTQQVMRRPMFMPPPPGYATGTDYATWDPYTAMSASDSSGAYNSGSFNTFPSSSYFDSIPPAQTGSGLMRQSLFGGMANFDLGAQVGVPMTVQQRNDIANAAYGNYATGTLGDLRVPYVTGAQVNTILHPPTAAQPTQPSPGAASVNATNFPTTYNTANTAAAGTPIAGQTATSTGNHIDVATGVGGATGTGGGGLPTIEPSSGADPTSLPAGAIDSYAAASGKMAGGVSSQMESRMPGAPGNWDLGAMLGVPMTAGQRNELSRIVGENWTNDAWNAPGHQLNFGNWKPYLTQTQIDSVLGPSNSAPAYPQITPAAYNAVNTAPAGTPIAGQTATSTGFHIDVNTGRLVPNVATAAPPAAQQPAQAAAPVQQQAPAQQWPTTPPPPKPAAPSVNPTAVFTNPYSFTPGPPNGSSTGVFMPPPPATATIPPPGGTTTTPPPTGTTGGTTTAPPPGTTTTTPPPAATNGATTPSAIAYDPSVYANLPALQYLKGLVSPQDFANLTSSPSSASGLGGELPAPNQLNYADLNYLKATDPTGYAVLVALFKARNRDLEQEMQYAQQRAPISNAQNTDTIST